MRPQSNVCSHDTERGGRQREGRGHRRFRGNVAAELRFPCAGGLAGNTRWRPGGNAVGDLRVGCQHVAEHEPVALHGCPDLACDGGVEDGTGVDECVELAVLATWIDVRWKVVEQLGVKPAAGKRRIESAWVDADQDRLKTRIDELTSQRVRVAAPQRKDGLLADPAEPLLAVRADVGQKQVAERDRLRSASGASASACPIRCSYTSLAQAAGISTSTRARPVAWAWRRSSSRRTPCIEIRASSAVTVVISARGGGPERCCSSCSASAESFPPLQDNANTLGYGSCRR